MKLKKSLAVMFLAFMMLGMFSFSTGLNASEVIGCEAYLRCGGSEAYCSVTYCTNWYCMAGPGFIECYCDGMVFTAWCDLAN